jgi:hypothetical protein
LEAAAIVLQALLRTFLAQGKIERKRAFLIKKEQADMFYDDCLVREYFNKWRVSWEWKEHWRDKMLRKRLKYKHNVHRFLGMAQIFLVFILFRKTFSCKRNIR